MEKFLPETNFMCALRKDHQVSCWGKEVDFLPENEWGKHRKPFKVTALPTPAKAASLFYGTLCITSTDDALWCVGSNRYGQLRFPASGDWSSFATKHPVLSGVRQVTFPGGCGLLGTGLACWDGFRPEVHPVTSITTPVEELVGGSDYACARLRNGEVWCYGANIRGQSGLLEYSEQFRKLNELGNDVTQISSSGRHTCAVKRDGSVWCWGENERGQSGTGFVSICKVNARAEIVCYPEEPHVPAQVVQLPPARAVSTVGTTSCAITRNDEVWCWGSLPEPQPIPTKLPLKEPAAEVAIGLDPSCVAFRSGRLSCWDPMMDVMHTQPSDVDLGCAR